MPYQIYIQFLKMCHKNKVSFTDLEEKEKKQQIEVEREKKKKIRKENIIKWLDTPVLWD